MPTVLIHFIETTPALHPLLNDDREAKSEVVEVDSLTDLNSLYSNITKIDILS